MIRVEDLPPTVPPNHYNLLARKIVGSSTGSKVMEASLVRMERGGRVEPHVHKNEESLFIVLKGEMGLKVNQEEIRLKSGDAALIYPGEIHNNYSIGEVETEYITIRARIQ